MAGTLMFLSAGAYNYFVYYVTCICLLSILHLMSIYIMLILAGETGYAIMPAPT